MERVKINGAELEFEVRGSGEPVLLMHCGFVAEGFAPLLGEVALTERYQLINYHRRGYAGSQHPDGLISMEQQAEDGRALLQHLGIEQVHLVGHSFGANVALQLALSAPEMIHTLALLEPTLSFALSEASSSLIMEGIGKSFGLYGGGDKTGAVDTWLQGAFGPTYRSVLDRVLPGAFEQAVNDADTIFQVEAASLQQWQFGPDEIRRIKQPVLSVFHVDPIWSGFQDTHNALLAGLPQTETLVLPNSTHLLQIMNPRSMAEGLANFFTRHPLPVNFRAGSSSGSSLK